ncbi:MAG TPA: glycosyltransferase family 4 protein [Candidatus Saccharimonadales bacterium]|nr:glycosyltransferase family 4 protein [Candidatus Saccharimonadales bacterium]
MLGWELPPHNSGGLGVACYQLCQELSKDNNIQIEFILPYHAEHEADFMTITAARPVGVTEIIKTSGAYDSYKYRYEDGHEEWHDIYAQAAHYEKGVASLAFSKEFDIVHAHDWLTFRAALRLKELTGCPIVLHVHSVESDRAGGERGNPLVHEIEATAFTLADRVIAVSEHTKKAIVRDYGIPADKIVVVHNSIKVEDLAPLDNRNTYEYLVQLKMQDYRVVTNIGRLTVQKGLPNLLRAAKEVIARAPKTIFLIVGSGEQYHELIELAADLGIGRNVIFTGFLRGKQWRDAFAIADLFVMPSVSEPFGLTPLEATGYGTPSLVSKQAGVSEVLRNCLKVDYWDINEMANQIVAVVQNDSLRRELTANAYRELQHLSWEEPARKVINVYRDHTALEASA